MSFPFDLRSLDKDTSPSQFAAIAKRLLSDAESLGECDLEDMLQFGAIVRPIGDVATYLGASSLFKQSREISRPLPAEDFGGGWACSRDDFSAFLADCVEVGKQLSRSASRSPIRDKRKQRIASEKAYAWHRRATSALGTSATRQEQFTWAMGQPGGREELPPDWESYSRYVRIAIANRKNPASK